MTAAAFSKPFHHPNEDRYIADVDLKLFGVFDGVGGITGGSAAAKIAADIIKGFFKEQKYKNKNLPVKKLLIAAILEAAKNINLDGQVYGRVDECTTTTIAKILQNKLTIANVGDSRCYGLTKARELKRFTIDHGILEELLRKGKITLEEALKIDQAKSLEELSNDELLLFNQRHVIIKALDAQFSPDDIEFNEVDLKKFKTLILTTDGVHDNLTDLEIEKIVSPENPPENLAKNLVEAAFAVSQKKLLRSKPDDITAVVVNL